LKQQQGLLFLYWGLPPYRAEVNPKALNLAYLVLAAIPPVRKSFLLSSLDKSARVGYLKTGF
jgi:hypothetical protein